MFAGALAACWERGLEPFYFEIKDHNIIFIRDGTTVPFVGAKSTDDYFALNGFDVITRGRWEDAPCRAERLDVTRKLWNARRTLGALYQQAEFRKYRVPWGKSPNPQFNWTWGNSQATFRPRVSANLRLDGDNIAVPLCEDFGAYLGGGWLEEYVFALLRELEVRGLIHDVRIGMEVNFSVKNQHHKSVKNQHQKEPPSGECDCAFTDGKRLWSARQETSSRSISRNWRTT